MLKPHSDALISGAPRKQKQTNKVTLQQITRDPSAMKPVLLLSDAMVKAGIAGIGSDEEPPRPKSANDRSNFVKFHSIAISPDE